MNQFFTYKIKLPNLCTFYVTWINLLFMKHKLINFIWIVYNLIVRNHCLNLIKELIQKQLLTEQMFFETRVLKNFVIFRGKHLCWTCIFNKVAGMQLSCEYCEFFTNNFFRKTSPVAAYEKSWQNFNVYLSLLHEILDNICIVIVC